MSSMFLNSASGPDIGLGTARRFGREGYSVVLGLPQRGAFTGRGR